MVIPTKFGFNPIAGDWLLYFKRRLPLRSMLTGVSKGRSAKALRCRAAQLSEKPETKSIGSLLSKYHDNILVATQWRGGKAIHVLSDSEYETELKTSFRRLVCASS